MDAKSIPSYVYHQKWQQLLSGTCKSILQESGIWSNNLNNDDEVIQNYHVLMTNVYMNDYAETSKGFKFSSFKRVD